MSKLDDIIRKAKAIKSESGEGWSGFTYLTDAQQDKRDIQELMLELIEETDPGKSDSKVYWGNVLRKKVEEL